MRTRILHAFSSLAVLLISTTANAQVTYLGLRPEKAPLHNARMQVRNDSLFVPTRDGLWKKALGSSDTLWSPAGFQGMVVNDFVFVGADTIVCAIDSTEGHTVFYSPDHGATVLDITNGFGGTGIDYFPAMRIAANPDDPQELLAMASACVARSTDFGQSWTPILLDWGYLVYQSTVLQFHPIDPMRIYACGELALFDSFCNYSFDGGGNWSTSLVTINNAVNGIGFHPTAIDTILVGKEGQIERSADGGVSWEVVYYTPNYEYIYAPVYDPVDPQTIYAAGAPNGMYAAWRIFRSTDGGTSWSEWFYSPAQQEQGHIMSLVVHGQSLYFLALGIDRQTGVFRIDDISTAAHETLPIPSRDLSIQPVPAMDQVNVSVDGHRFTGACWIMDGSGRQTMLRSENGVLDLRELAPGCYAVKATDPKGTLHGRIVKQ